MSESNKVEVRTFERKNVMVDREIGQGRFARVYLATIIDSNLPPVAVKVLTSDDSATEELIKNEKDRAYEELFKLAVLDHENIVKLHGMIRDDDFPWLVFEFMKDGSLLEYVSRNPGSIKETSLIRYCRDICQGMTFLHNNNVLHKDLAARNILIDGRTAKIADLGLSSFLTTDNDEVYTLNGKLFPFRHAATECVVEQIFTRESDVWSYGVLMYEIFSGGMTPYGKENKQPEVRRFIVDRITPLDIAEPNCSPKIYSLTKMILNPVREDRPTFQYLLQTFQMLLNGKALSQGIMNQNTASPVLATFHNLKSSRSSNNIGMSTTPTSTKFYTSHQHDGSLLTPTYESAHSASSPNLVDPENFYDKRVGYLVSTDLRDENERRHSYGNVEAFPLESSHMNFMPKNELDNGPNWDEIQQRRRANSIVQVATHQTNPLLEGFVQNRFAKRQQPSARNFV